MDSLFSFFVTLCHGDSPKEMEHLPSYLTESEILCTYVYGYADNSYAKWLSVRCNIKTADGFRS